MDFRSITKVLALGVLVAVGAPAAKGDLIIDSFETSQAYTADSFTPHDSGVVSGAGILGGERDSHAFYTSGDNDVQVVANSVNNGLLNFSLGADTDGYGRIIWDGADGDADVTNYTGLGNADLTDGGTLDRLAVGVQFDDLPVALNFTVFTDAGNSSTGTLNLPGGTPSAVTFELLFSDFAAAMGTGADFANVGAIELEIAPGVPATDLQIDFITSTTRVPEPASAMLGLLGLGGVVVARRRR